VHIAAAEFSSEVPDQVIVYHDEKKIVDMLEAINEKLDIRMGYKAKELRFVIRKGHKP